MNRFNIRWLNHNGDYINIILTLLFVSAFVAIRYGYHFEQIGPPIVNFTPIVPKGNARFSYYGLPNPQQKKEPQLLELAKDPLLSHFKFVDITKILPYSDPACPGEGICDERT